MHRTVIYIENSYHVCERYTAQKLNYNEAKNSRARGASDINLEIINVTWQADTVFLIKES